MRKLWVVSGVVLVVISGLGAHAQGDKPWLRSGSRTGEEIVGPDGARMVWVPAGEFMMGADDGAAPEKPVHRVRITRGFWLAKYETSLGQWKRYGQAAGVPVKPGVTEPADDYPMGGTNWDDAQAYCRFYGLALPTEAQWEWAARGPEGRRYPWGNQWDASRCCNNDNPGPDGFTCPVGRFPQGASWCGAQDMAGNLAEWCQDWYGADYYAVSPQVDPTGPATGTERVQRGGYCWANAKDCRTTARFGDDPANRDGSGCLRACYTP